jgi:hypothetical protein
MEIIYSPYGDRFEIVRTRACGDFVASDDSLISIEQMEEWKKNQEAYKQKYDDFIAANARYAAIQAEREARRLKKEEQEHKLKYDLCGYTDNMPNIKAEKIANVLNKRVSINGKSMTRKEFICMAAAENGQFFEKQYTGDKSITYGVYDWIEKNTFYKITKTEYDFGMYLLKQVSN